MSMAASFCSPFLSSQSPETLPKDWGFIVFIYLFIFAEVEWKHIGPDNLQNKSYKKVKKLQQQAHREALGRGCYTFRQTLKEHPLRFSSNRQNVLPDMLIWEITHDRMPWFPVSKAVARPNRIRTQQQVFSAFRVSIKHQSHCSGATTKKARMMCGSCRLHEWQIPLAIYSWILYSYHFSHQICFGIHVSTTLNAFNGFKSYKQNKTTFKYKLSKILRSTNKNIEK